MLFNGGDDIETYHLNREDNPTQMHFGNGSELVKKCIFRITGESIE